MAPTELVVESEEDLELLLSMKRQVTEEEEEDEMPLSARKRARSALQSETCNLLPDEVFIVSKSDHCLPLSATPSCCRNINDTD